MKPDYERILVNDIEYVPAHIAQARVDAAYEDAAKVIDAECERILALQDGREPQVDQNLRMVVALLPDLAAAIRAKASQKGEGNGNA